ncbi:MAG: hypothetical protein H0V88_05455 [Pyrinomonadaceae bacterium]|nr:hypothetical protein [Pyrinomonadaceae bacterium]
MDGYYRDVLLSLFLVAIGFIFIAFNHGLAKKAQQNISKIIGDPHDKGEIIRRRIELLIVGVSSLLVGLWLLAKLFVA